MKNKYKLIMLLTILLIVLSCSVKLVSDYDAKTADKIIELSKRIDLFYLNLKEIQPEERFFQNVAEEYKLIEIEIRSLVLMNKIRPYNKHSIKNAENLLTNWIEIKNEHKNNDSYNIDMAVEDVDILQDQLLELLKKEQVKQ
jgi:hypothetical protein